MDTNALSKYVGNEVRISKASSLSTALTHCSATSGGMSGSREDRRNSISALPNERAKMREVIFS